MSMVFVLCDSFSFYQIDNVGFQVHVFSLVKVKVNLSVFDKPKNLGTYLLQ